VFLAISDGDRVDGGNARKPTTYSTSVNRSGTGLTGNLHAHRSKLIALDRVQITNPSMHEHHLPSIRDITVNAERSCQQANYDDRSFRSHTKVPVHIPSVSASSILNVLVKRSMNNAMNINDDMDTAHVTSPVPPSRRSRRSINAMGKESTLNSSSLVKQASKTLADSGVDLHYSSGSIDHNQWNHARIKYRTQAAKVSHASPLVSEPITKAGMSISTGNNMHYLFSTVN
jgi:hypothetical protein